MRPASNLPLAVALLVALVLATFALHIPIV